MSEWVVIIKATLTMSSKCDQGWTHTVSETQTKSQPHLMLRYFFFLVRETAGHCVLQWHGCLSSLAAPNNNHPAFCFDRPAPLVRLDEDFLKAGVILSKASQRQHSWINSGVSVWAYAFRPVALNCLLWVSIVSLIHLSCLYCCIVPQGKPTLQLCSAAN